jgi:hypothetical protein
MDRCAHLHRNHRTPGFGRFEPRSYILLMSRPSSGELWQPGCLPPLGAERHAEDDVAAIRESDRPGGRRVADVAADGLEWFDGTARSNVLEFTAAANGYEDIPAVSPTWAPYGGQGQRPGWADCAVEKARSGHS